MNRYDINSNEWHQDFDPNTITWQKTTDWLGDPDYKLCVYRGLIYKIDYVERRFILTDEPAISVFDPTNNTWRIIADSRDCEVDQFELIQDIFVYHDTLYLIWEQFRCDENCRDCRYTETI